MADLGVPILAEPTYPTQAYPVTPEDVRRILQYYSPSELSGVERIVLARPRLLEPRQLRAFGAFTITRREILLFSLPVRCKALPEACFFVLRDLGTIRAVGPVVTPAAAKMKYMFDVLPHEVQHAIDFANNLPFQSIEEAEASAARGAEAFRMRVGVRPEPLFTVGLRSCCI